MSKLSQTALDEATAKKVVKDAIRAAGNTSADELVVGLSWSQVGNTRFANNGITTTGDVESLNVSITATIDGKSATVSGNRIDKKALNELVTQAADLAAVSPANPEHMPPLGKQKFPRIKGVDAAAAKMGPAQRGEAAAKAIDIAKGAGVVAAGLVTHAERVSVVASSSGLFGFHPSTEVTMSTTSRTPDGKGSGRAAFVSHRAKDLDAERLARRATETATASSNLKKADPGDYTVLLEAQAVADLLGFMLGSMGTRAADEGRSFFSKSGGGTKLGLQLFDPRITITSSPEDNDHPSNPWGGGGLPQQPRTWIESGVLKQLTVSRYWAQKTGAEPIAYPGSIFMAGTSKTLDDLLKDAGEGIAVSRFWYNRSLEPRSILVTGLTRDGTFRVEGGKKVHAVNNFRYNDSPISMLKNVVALGIPERVPTRRGMVMVVPPMVVKGFHFSSTSDAV